MPPSGRCQIASKQACSPSRPSSAQTSSRVELGRVDAERLLQRALQRARGSARSRAAAAVRARPAAAHAAARAACAGPSARTSTSRPATRCRRGRRGCSGGCRARAPSTIASNSALAEHRLELRPHPARPPRVHDPDRLGVLVDAVAVGVDAGARRRAATRAAWRPRRAAPGRAARRARAAPTAARRRRAGPPSPRRPSPRPAAGSVALRAPATSRRTRSSSSFER